MNLAPIEMDRTTARKQFLEYRHAVRERHNAEDEQIMRGYRELSSGKQLINITDVMHQAGQQENGMPKLAICRADERSCYIETGESSITFVGYKPPETQRWGAHRSSLRRVRTNGWGTVPTWQTRDSLRAMVPIVPAGLRPKHHLRNFHILWEAEWEPVPRPPVDPALLKRIGGDLFAVVAVWELTELERSVLAGRNW